ncbi:fluoride efflux transporter CrcB [Neobacillus muris]|uniref:fluoride efflux transporter CrcB n=1 Tax=Neobacillus muris TaxID=2941334 RepID=UPI00203CDA20|nr:fluoride efflux transporter CrcB [Neobacillus muris]
MVYLFVGMGGVIGSLLRYGISLLTAHIWEGAFPLGTLIINLSGAFALGWVTSRLSNSKRIPSQLLTGLTTGVIGSYTTFSTFCLETIHLMEEAYYTLAIIYLALSFIGGILLVRTGAAVGGGSNKEAGKLV